jgi:hypothetical protein
MLMDRLSISERRACRAIGQPVPPSAGRCQGRESKRSTSGPGCGHWLGLTPAMGIGG